jgi:ApaG protein
MKIFPNLERISAVMHGAGLSSRHLIKTKSFPWTVRLTGNSKIAFSMLCNNFPSERTQTQLVQHYLLNSHKYTLAFIKKLRSNSHNIIFYDPIMSEKNKILVEAVPHFIAAQSAPDQDRYVFSYTITITNAGAVPAKLLTRHWLITDANGKVQEVRGDGVIGEQPYLKPGESFRYTSGAMIETPVGTMQGEYIMRSDEGDNFSARIPRFTLSIPRTLH